MLQSYSILLIPEEHLNTLDIKYRNPIARQASKGDR